MALEISNRAYVLEIGKIIMEGTEKVISSSEEILKAYLG